MESRPNNSVITSPQGRQVIGLSNARLPANGFLTSKCCYTVQAASPVHSSWKQWKEETKAKVSFMDVWSDFELLALA